MAKTEAENKLALLKRNTVDVVADRVRELQESGELHLPANYSAENAMKSAWLALQSTVDKQKRPVLNVCTHNSIANALLDMVVQGLNPAKQQCYFIAYGDTLVCHRSYFGSMALVRRIYPDADIWYGVVYEGDDFEYTIERGRKTVVKHVQRIENVQPDRIVGAYCVIEPGNDRLPHTETMTIDQIKRAWQQGQTYRVSGNGVHQKFSDQMAAKTVINRACKAIINSSSDDYLLLYHAGRSDEVRDEVELAEEIAVNANAEVIDVADEALEEPQDAKREGPARGPGDAAAPPQEAQQLPLEGGPDF